MALRRNNQSNQVTEPKTKWKSSWKYFKAYFFFSEKSSCHENNKKLSGNENLWRWGGFYLCL